jgi:serralysin
MSVQTFKSRYFGEAGDDAFFSVGWQNTFNGGSGIDSISYGQRTQDPDQGDTGVTVNLAQGFARTGRNQTETLISIDNATGSGKDDTIIGSKGANRIEGAGGVDDLTGGAGADTFVFSRVSHSQIENRQIDLIFDFRRSEGDKVDLSAIDVNENRPGMQNFAFIGEAAFSGRAGELRIQSLSDGVRITGDVDGDRRADFYIGVLDIASLRASDFIL